LILGTVVEHHGSESSYLLGEGLLAASNNGRKSVISPLG
jgi:hypothetical protein